jgi:hypothetical protein
MILFCSKCLRITLQRYTLAFFEQVISPAVNDLIVRCVQAEYTSHHVCHFMLSGDTVVAVHTSCVRKQPVARQSG